MDPSKEQPCVARYAIFDSFLRLDPTSLHDTLEDQCTSHAFSTPFQFGKPDILNIVRQVFIGVSVISFPASRFVAFDTIYFLLITPLIDDMVLLASYGYYEG